MAIKEKDFIAVTYTGRLKDNNKIFDTNNLELAKKEKLFNPKHSYDPEVICVSQSDVVKGLDESFIGKEVNQDYTVEITPEKGFGKRDAKLFQLISAKVFKDQQIRPVPGLPVTINNMPGTVKTVSGGRILVDFNHPLSGKTILYEVKIKKIVTDIKEKAEGYLKLFLGLKQVPIEAKENNLEIKLKLPENIQEVTKANLKERIPELKEVTFKE
jgi:FKBP-type peptidyl-prolyl cis-trans isomerase 2